MRFSFLYQESPLAGLTLTCTRVFSSCVLSILGVYLIEHPVGFFHDHGGLSLTGKVMMSFWIILTVMSLLGLLARQIWANPLSLTVIFSSVLTFALAIPQDPLLAGAMVFCQTYLGITGLLYALPSRERSPYQGHQLPLEKFYENAPLLESWLHRYRKSLAHLLCLSGVLTTLVFGFKVASHPEVALIVIGVLIFSTLIVLRLLYVMYCHGGSRSFVLWMLALVVMALLSRGLWEGALSGVFVLLFILAIYSYLLAQSPVFRDSLESFQSAPALFVLMSFAGLVVLGTLLLSLPAALQEGVQVSFMASLFTAVSATCVTGLSVLNIAHTYSEFGQFILLVLIQMGGLGIMVLSTFATLAFGGRLGVRTEKAFAEFFSRKGMKSTHQLIVFIIVSTVLIEMLGAAALAYYHLGEGMEFVPAIKLGVFQSISAFCNAGFSLTEDSLTHLSTSPGPMIIYGALIVLGGLGFVVLFEMVRSVAPKRLRGKLSIQTKIVLLMSTLLVVGGAALFALLEWQGALAALGVRDKIMGSLFQSITLRTAGFYAIHPADFAYPSMVVMFFLMFVGGAPGGTAGGVKVTTLTALLATLPTLLRNDNRITLFSRRFSMQIIAKSSALIILSGATVGVLWFLLLLTQEGTPTALLFEVFSATGTVGLTLGVTESLDPLGQMIITVGMFVGRIGPLTLAIALAQDERSRIDYPSADIMIG